MADLDGEVVGTMQLTFMPSLSRRGGERAEIEAVRVAASQRGAGLGRRMIGWAVDEARARGCALVQLTTDKRRADAHRFYESLGFTATHEGMKLTLIADARWPGPSVITTWLPPHRRSARGPRLPGRRSRASAQARGDMRHVAGDRRTRAGGRRAARADHGQPSVLRSQLAAFLRLGCTRGGSPGIFGWSGG